jgi:ABC-type branched-subunit amino acid transport system ATPase component
VTLAGSLRAPGLAEATGQDGSAVRVTVRPITEGGAAVLVVEQRAKAVLAISDYTYVLGGGQVLMEGTPARLAASQEFTESFFGAVPQTPK